MVQEHREAIEKTESLMRSNKEVEKRIEQIQGHLQDYDLAKKEIQEQFS